MEQALISQIREAFSVRGRMIAFASLNHVCELADDLERHHAGGAIAESIWSLYLKSFVYSPTGKLPNARSVMLVASPIGRAAILLDTAEGSIELTIPPTYGAEDQVASNEEILSSVLTGPGIGFSRARLPLKSLAAHTGLGRYGRNNVQYFGNAGSYVRLDAWWTELEADSESWGQPLLLAGCAECHACESACPNGCFKAGRFIIDAARCLTALNELEDPFPSWVDPNAHNAVVGCLRCQEACPENRLAIGNQVQRRILLDRAESEALLTGKAMPDSPNVAAAMRAADMTGMEKAFIRNIRALVAAQRSSFKLV